MRKTIPDFPGLRPLINAKKGVASSIGQLLFRQARSVSLLAKIRYGGDWPLILFALSAPRVLSVDLCHPT